MGTFSLGASPLKQPRPTNANTQNVTPLSADMKTEFSPADYALMSARLNALTGAELASV